VAIDIIVEDGSIVANANSYTELAFVKSFAANRGVTLIDADDEKTKAKMILAMDYIESFGSKFLGSPTSLAQSLSWPRSNVRMNCEDFPNNEIPSQLPRAQAQLVIEQANGVVIMPTVSGAFVTKEKVGPIETEYSEALAIAAGQTPNMPAVDALLSGLFSAGSFRLKTYRA
jgi:hypothetical protein